MKKILFLMVLPFLAACHKEQLSTPDLQGKNLSGRFPVSGTTYYIDPAGSDTNNGISISTPFQHIAKINTITLNPGDQVLFKCGGSWTGQLYPKGSGSSGSPIIIDKYGSGANPKIDGSGTSSGILIYNRSYYEINNLEVVNSGTSVPLRGIYVQNTDTSSTPRNHIYIKNCFVHNITVPIIDTLNLYKVKATTGGIIIDGYYNDLIVQNCHVENTAAEGIRTTAGSSHAHKSTSVQFLSNRVDSVQGDGIVLNTVDHGLIANNVVAYPCMDNSKDYAGCWTYNSNGTIVKNNEVYGIKGGKGDGEAFDADQYTDGDIYEYNYSHNNGGGFMLFMPTAKNVIARYNVSVNDCVSGTRLLNYQPDNTNINTLYNNVFYITPSQSLTLNRIIDGRIDGFAGTLKNNIIYCAPNVTVNTFCKGTGIYSPSGVFMNNCFYPASITATNGPSGTVSGNINTDPLFNNPSTGDFSLTNPSSPCLNAGVTIINNGSYDYKNSAVPSTGNPDIGAYQHSTTPNNFGASADAYVRDGVYANNNYGTSDSLWVKSDATSYNRRSYITFGYSALTTQKVQSATLTLYAFRVNTDPNRTISVYTTATNTWGEGTLKWSNAPMDTTYVGTITVTGTGTKTIDVTNAINAQVTKNVSFLLMNKAAPSTSNDVEFYSRNAATHQPQLSVTY